ncbi:MAG: FkbM family methyltransferase [Tateyamaria sp.]|uniref:FkbM family methyltransferase n=1 Tax=Tateyamaria sp. TaxID=1929288 RepID=UPI0032A0E8E1
MDGGNNIDPTGTIKSRALKFPKDGTYLTGKVRGLLRSGDYEKDLTAAALKATRADDRVLDLGCGLGFVAGMIAKRRNVEAIFGYDGNPNLLTYAEAMLATNGISNVTLTHAVLGKRKSSVPFYVRAPFAGSSLLAQEGGDGTEIQVDMINVKTATNAHKPTVVICDIEGGEADLFDDMPLKGVRQVVVKLHPGHIGHDGMMGLFKAMGQANLSYDPRISAGRIVGFSAE